MVLLHTPSHKLYTNSRKATVNFSGPWIIVKVYKNSLMLSDLEGVLLADLVSKRRVKPIEAYSNTFRPDFVKSNVEFDQPQQSRGVVDYDIVNDCAVNDADTQFLLQEDAVEDKKDCQVVNSVLQSAKTVGAVDGTGDFIVKSTLVPDKAGESKCSIVDTQLKVTDRNRWRRGREETLVYPFGLSTSGTWVPSNLL